MDRLFLRVLPVKVNENQKRNHYLIFQIKTDRDYEKAKQYYIQHIHGQDILLLLEPWQYKSSKKQIDFLHVIIDIISKETYTPRALVKEGIKEKYYPRREYLGIRVITPTMMLTRREISTAITGAIIEAGELGINIDDYRKEWEKWKQQHPE